MRFRTTREVADELGVKYFQLFNLVRYGHIPAPPKTGSGDYCWSDYDVAAARRIIDSRRRPQLELTPA